MIREWKLAGANGIGWGKKPVGVPFHPTQTLHWLRFRMERKSRAPVCRGDWILYRGSQLCWSWVRNLLRSALLAPRIVKWPFDFQKIYAPLQYDEFRFSDICKARFMFPAPDTVPAKGRTKCGSKTIFPLEPFIESCRSSVLPFISNFSLPVPLPSVRIIRKPWIHLAVL